MRRLRHLAAVVALLAAALFGVPATANAAALPIGQCTTTHGVILAVDFGHWGGPVLRACGTATGTGMDLLNEGGWHTQGDRHDGPAFICRIGYSGYQHGTMYPTPVQDPCVLTPPASAYWSYWLAKAGQNTWTYSSRGAFQDHPTDGEVEAWVFGATDIGGTTGQPDFSPNQVRAHNTAPIAAPPNPASPRQAPPAATPPADGAPATHAGSTTHAGHAAAGSTPSGHRSVTKSTTATAVPAPARTTGTCVTVPTRTSPTTPISATEPSCQSSTVPTFQNARPRADVVASPGSPWSLIIGGVVVLALAVGGGVTVWRRRSRT